MAIFDGGRKKRKKSFGKNLKFPLDFLFGISYNTTVAAIKAVAIYKMRH